MSSKEAPKSDNLAPLYRERLVHLKQAQSFSAKGDIPKAVDRYKKYLHCLALINNTSEEKLSPKMFDKEKDLTELFLISHCYWDLAKAYDRAPALKKDARRTLDQFILFTIGFKYQHVNYRMLKKFVRQKTAHNPEHFQEALKRLKVETKGCYIATHAFGDQAPETQSLRQFKHALLRWRVGHLFVDFYYSYSPNLISFLKRHPRTDRLFTHLLTKPLLRLLTFFVRS